MNYFFKKHTLKFLYSILSLLGFPVIIYNHKGFIVFINKKAASLFGYKPNELIHCSFLKLIPFKMLPKNLEMFESILENKNITHKYVLKQRLNKKGYVVDILVRTLCFSSANTFLCIFKQLS